MSLKGPFFIQATLVGIILRGLPLEYKDKLPCSVAGIIKLVIILSNCVCYRDVICYSHYKTILLARVRTSIIKNE